MQGTKQLSLNSVDTPPTLLRLRSLSKWEMGDSVIIYHYYM